jgi:hypothetical protein
MIPNKSLSHTRALSPQARPLGPSLGLNPCARSAGKSEALSLSINFSLATNARAPQARPLGLNPRACSAGTQDGGVGGRWGSILLDTTDTSAPLRSLIWARQRPARSAPIQSFFPTPLSKSSGLSITRDRSRTSQEEQPHHHSLSFSEAGFAW